jgi:hypothetical protein
MESVENADSVAISEKRAISLLDEEKHWLIDRLACYGSITEIARDFHETFGRVIPKSTVSYYDPMTLPVFKVGACFRSNGRNYLLHGANASWMMCRQSRLPIHRIV